MQHYYQQVCLQIIPSSSSTTSLELRSTRFSKLTSVERDISPSEISSILCWRTSLLAPATTLVCWDLLIYCHLRIILDMWKPHLSKPHYVVFTIEASYLKGKKIRGRELTFSHEISDYSSGRRYRDSIIGALKNEVDESYSSRTLQLAKALTQRSLFLPCIKLPCNIKQINTTFTQTQHIQGQTTLGLVSNLLIDKVSHVIKSNFF